MVMPSSVMEERQGLPLLRNSATTCNGNSSSFFSEELHFPEKQIGFWRQDAAALDQKGSRSVFSSPLEKPHPANPYPSRETNFGLRYDLSMWGDASLNSGSPPVLSLKPVLPREVDAGNPHLSNEENGHFVSSVSEMFNKKATISSNGVLGQSIGSVYSSPGEDDIFEPMEDIDVQAIRDLLPDDDDLISGILDDFECRPPPTKGDDNDEDIFCVAGGMELENDDSLKGGVEHSYGQPSRTLFVRNISNNVEDSEIKALFQKYGDIHTLHASCKHCGLVKVSFFDLRAAQKAMKALKNKPLGPHKLDIHFALPQKNHLTKDMIEGAVLLYYLDASLTDDDLLQICGAFGDVREISEASKNHCKCVKFYDIRAAEATFHALNSSDAAGKKFRVELGHPQQWIMQEEQEECNECYQRRLSNPQTWNFAKAGSRHLDNGVVHGSCSPMKPSMEKAYNTTNAHSISSPVKFGAAIHNHNNSVPGTFSHVNTGYQGMHVQRPRSLSDYQRRMINGLPYSSDSMNGADLHSGPEGLDCGNLHPQLVSRSFHGQPFDQNSAFAVARFGSCPRHGAGNQYLLDPSGMIPQNLSVPIMWPSPSPHPHGYPGPTHIASGMPIEQHHISSAPVYQGNFIDAPPSIHAGSLGCMAYPGSSQLYPMEVAQFHSFAPQRGKMGDSIITSVNVGVLSPQQRSHNFHGRNSAISMSCSHESPNERSRNRRHDSNASQVENRKQYELDIERIKRGEDSRTTLMIKNIPNKYTCKLLLAVINEKHHGTYDFFYLPIDFKNQCNVGYAFINMTDPKHIVPFYQTFNGRKWEKFNSEKVTMLAYARIQGKSALISHFQNSSLMNEDKRCRPMLFHTDGPNAGDQEPFPVGLHVRSRSGRNRGYAHMEHHIGSPSSSSPNHENSDSGADSPSSGKGSA